MKQAYSLDIHLHLNYLKNSMQGKKQNILTFTYLYEYKHLAFKNKHLSRGNVEAFSLLFQVQTQTE